MTKNLSNLNTGEHKPLDLPELKRKKPMALTIQGLEELKKQYQPFGLQPGFYSTRGGLKAEVFVERNGYFYGRIADANYATVWIKSGRLSPSECSEFDLIAPWKEPVTHEVWINVYGFGLSDVHSTETSADSAASDERIDCRKLRYVEGKGITDITGDV